MNQISRVFDWKERDGKGERGGGWVYLSTTSGILGGSTSNQFGIVVIEEFVVKTHVLLLCENRVIGFEPIFLK